MFIVNVPQTWPLVLAGKADPAIVTLGAWAAIKESDLVEHADAVLGVFRDTVVTAYDVESWTRGPGNRVTFVGPPSERWAHLIGTPNPGRRWVRGASRPVQTLDTAVLTDGDVPAADTPTGRRAVIDGYTLTVGEHGATVQAPPGGRVTVATAA